MSPFSQLGHVRGFRGDIDHQLTPVISYLDELNRHFSPNHHHFMNCFIPRFDLTEDDRFYYLCGEVPGAKADEITIEPSNDHTLHIYGTTCRSNGVLIASQDTPEQESNAQDVERDDAISSASADKGAEFQSRQVRLPFQHHTAGGSGRGNNSNASLQPHQGFILSERLVGNFRRKFDFPMPIEEEAVKANLENGLLSLLIPKKVQFRDMDKPKKIPVVEVH
jgi:HSP20 family protein